jgi:LuxR family transcriptional regulator, maltose regulon positive regulatory protein
VTAREEAKEAEMTGKLPPYPGCRLLLVLMSPDGEEVVWLRAWLADRRLPVAWIVLDSVDNLPTRFLARLREALAAAGLVPAGISSDAVDLLNALADRQAPELVVVLENYDAIEAAEVHAIVQLMLDYPPPGLLVVLVSETMPPLALARLRVRRQLVEVRLAPSGRP